MEGQTLHLQCYRKLKFSIEMLNKLCKAHQPYEDHCC